MVIITVKGVDYNCIIHGISKSEAICLQENSVLYVGVYIKCTSKKIDIENSV